MKNNISNKYFGSPKISSKPYERKIKLNQISPKNYFTEVDINNLEENDKEIPPIKVNQIQSQKDYRYKELDNIKGYNLTEEFKKNQTDNSDNFQNNFEYNSHGRNSKNGDYGHFQNNENQNFAEINGDNETNSTKNKNDVNYVKKDYQFKYIDGDNLDDDNNEYPKYNYKYKYKKFQKDERNIEYDDKEKEEAEQNEEEDSKDDKEKLDLQELKKKPGKILHQSVLETYDDEGNRVVTTKTIKEFSQKTGGFRMRDFHHSKERKEYEKHTTNSIKNKFQKDREKKTNFSYKNKLNNKKGGDRIYLLAQLAKIKNDSEKKKKHRIYSSSISPIIIHESNGCENQNSIWSHEMIDPNSFDRETYERRNYNYNYPTNYGRININNEPDYEERCYYQSVNIRPHNMNQMQEDEYFIDPRRDVTSPIGYIATYSSGSEDNEEIGISHDQYLNRIKRNNYIKTNSKSKSKSKSIPEYNQEGELIKRRQITYQMEDPRNYADNYKIKAHNLSGLEIKAPIDNSKSDIKDFQSPDREFGVDSDKFRKVTMAMISSYGPTCEDRKITRKMRGELGGVVDLRQEISPVNNYKIKKVRRFGFNLKKEINPKTKLECAKIIQYWWRMLKERKDNRIKISKIIKLQSYVKGFLIRNQFIKLANLCTALEIIKNLYYNHYRDDILRFLKRLKNEKLKALLSRLINKTETKNINQKLVKYFFKYKFITNLLGKQINPIEETKEIKITEEMYINYIKEKYLKSNKSEHINELSIKEEEKKKNTNEQGTGIFSINEGIDKMNINYIKNKKEYKDSETYPIEQKMEMTKNNLEIKCSVNNKEEKKENIKYEFTKNEDFNIIYEKPELIIDKKEEYNILKSKKEYKDEEIQKQPELKEQGFSPIKIENKIIKNDFIKFIGQQKGKSQKVSPKKICKNEKISYIHKIIKIDKGQQMDSIKNIIKKNESINIISTTPKKKYYNAIKKSESFNIKNIKKKYQDEEIQYIPEKNSIQTQTFAFIKNKPKTKDNYSQYISSKSTICRANSYSIIRNPKKEIKYSIRKNNFSIIKKKKVTKERGEQCQFDQRYKYNQILIGNHIQRDNIVKLYEILENIWSKKQFVKFIKNCKSKIKDEALKKELMRMALLKWRFIKGYGGDKYGIIYDRNGKIIGEKEGQVKDASIQNTLNEEINNILLRNKKLQNKVSKQKPLYIKSNVSKKEMIETGTGDGLNNILNEKITKIVNIAYKKKPKSKGINKISGKNYFKISKVEKHYTNQGTTMLPIFNKIVTEKRMFINNGKINNKFYRRRDLLLQIISKCIIREKYKLHYYFINWYKNTKKIIEQERTRNLSINKSKIIKNEKFEIINKKDKRDKSCGNIYIPNKIVRGSKFEFRQKKLKKDEAVDISFPPQFKQENLQKNKINNDIYLPKKHPIVLRKTQGDIFSIFGSGQKREETETIILRKKQILTKFVKSKDKLTPESILRKYLIKWCRKAQYITLNENAKIITDFCRAKLNQIKLVQKWKNLYKKYVLNHSQKYIMKIIKKIKNRKKQILQLVRISTLIRFYNQKRFLHKIIMYWFIYSINAAKKRKQMKMLYENMLTTYVSMADDIFGKNQKNNPSIQDFMFEIVDTNKYQVKELEDVPMAKTYYSKKKEEKKVITNIKYINRDLEEEKETTIYKETSKYFYPRYNRENLLLNNRINNTEIKKGNLSKAINLSFNYNDSSIFEDKNSKKKENNNFYTPNEKKNLYKDFSKTNNNYSLNNSSYSNNNNNTNDYSYKYRKGNYSGYKIYNNNDTKINFNKININNNIYSNIKKDDKDNILYKGIYEQNNNNINNYESNTITKNKYSPINKYNNDQTKYSKYRRYNYNYNYNNEKNKRNNDDIDNNMNYYNKIKPEEKSKYISNYYRRNKNNYNENGNK